MNLGKQCKLHSLDAALPLLKIDPNLVADSHGCQHIDLTHCERMYVS